MQKRPILLRSLLLVATPYVSPDSTLAKYKRCWNPFITNTSGLLCLYIFGNYNVSVHIHLWKTNHCDSISMFATHTLSLSHTHSLTHTPYDIPNCKKTNFCKNANFCKRDQTTTTCTFLVCVCCHPDKNTHYEQIYMSMCICMYVCTCICMYVCMYVNIHEQKAPGSRVEVCV